MRAGDPGPAVQRRGPPASLTSVVRRKPMPYYRVSLHGRNFLINFDGESQKIGFHTARFVEAPDAKQAKAKALDVFLGSTKYQELVGAALNGENDPPSLSVEQVQPAEQSVVARVPG